MPWHTEYSSNVNLVVQGHKGSLTVTTYSIYHYTAHYVQLRI